MSVAERQKTPMPETHPSDDDLILHAYGESRPEMAGLIDAHLRACLQCTAVWTELRETLHLVNTADVPEPPPAFERIVWARVQQELFSPRPSLWSFRQWLPLAGVTAAVAFAAAGVTTHFSRTNGPTSPATASIDARGPERVLLTALDGHLEQTELLLIELLNGSADTAEVPLTYERATAEDLVSSGRLYRVTAKHQGDLRLAQVLEDIEPVLVDLARGPDRVDQSGLEALRLRIEDEALLFKVRTAAYEVRERQQSLINP
jgi:hypothetical protein